ncbi:cache domain-containing protein, partial [Bdellovibrionota bacterium FG-2]
LIDKVDRYFLERHHDVRALAQSPMLKEFLAAAQASGDAENVNATLDRALGICGLYTNILVLDSRGICLASGRGADLRGKSLENTTWFRASFAGKVHFSEVQKCETTGTDAVFCTAPVVDESGKVLGVVSTRTDWKCAQELIDGSGYEKGIVARIIDEKGMVLAATSGLGAGRDCVDWADSGQNAMMGFCGYGVETARNGIPMAVGFAREKGFDVNVGNPWSAVVSARLGSVAFEHFQRIVRDRSGSTSAEQIVAILALEGEIESERVNGELQETMVQINKLVSQINATNQETDMLAINAAVQAGIAGIEGESFAVIATEIGKLAKKSVEFVDAVNKTALDLQNAVEATVAARLNDAARDTIDKIDRLLFERVIAVRTWASHPTIVEGVLGKEDAREVCRAFLGRLMETYGFYQDIMLLDTEGTILATAARSELVGQKQANRQWFNDARAGKTHTTDIYRSDSVDDVTVAFSAPVLDEQGKVVGVLSSRLRWSAVGEILDAVSVDSQSSIYLLNSEGLVIGATNRSELMKKSFQHLRAFKEIERGLSGHLTESDPHDGQTYSIGYCKAKGFKVFAGKSWSVIIRRHTEALVAVLPVKEVA